jgi:hypothetical protein
MKRMVGSFRITSNCGLVISTFPETICSNADWPSGGSGGSGGDTPVSIDAAELSREEPSP